MVHHYDDFDGEQHAQRLFFEFESHIKDINRAAIGETAGPIGRDDMFRLASTVAGIRARYLKEALAMARLPDGETPNADALRRLRGWREAYEEALKGFGALRHAMKRGYFALDEGHDDRLAPAPVAVSDGN